MSTSSARRNIPRPIPRPATAVTKSAIPAAAAVAAPAPAPAPAPPSKANVKPSAPSTVKAPSKPKVAEAKVNVEPSPSAIPASLSREQLLDVLWTLPPQQMASLLAALTKNEASQPVENDGSEERTSAVVEIREKLATVDLEDAEVEELQPIKPQLVKEVVVAPPLVVAPMTTAPVQTFVPAPVAVAPVAMPAPAPAPVPVDLAPPPAPAPAARISVIDPMDVLFDAMYELNFFETSVEGASYCLASLLRALPARAGLVHLLDPDTRELVTVYAHGPNAERQILQRYTDEDWLMSAAICKHKPLIMNYGDDVGGRPMDRHAFFGGPRSVVVAPVINWGRCLAVIELIDPADGGVFDVRAENALTYVCDRYAEFLGEHGVDVTNVVAPPSGIIST